MSRCFCACHEHPGTYGGKYCGYCTHDHRLGHFPETVRDGWEPHVSPESQLAALRRLSRDVIDAWVRLGNCEEEFYPEFPGSCSEYADELDRTLSVLQSALNQMVIPTR